MFLEKILKEEKRLIALMDAADKEMNLSPKEEQSFQMATECYICEEEFKKR